MEATSWLGEKLKTDKNGQLIMDNLIPGDYCLVETKAPDHYRKLTAPASLYPFPQDRRDWADRRFRSDNYG